MTPGWRTDFLTRWASHPDADGDVVPRDKMASVLDRPTC